MQVISMSVFLPRDAKSTTFIGVNNESISPMGETLIRLAPRGVDLTKRVKDLEAGKLTWREVKDLIGAIYRTKQDRLSVLQHYSLFYGKVATTYQKNYILTRKRVRAEARKASEQGRLNKSHQKGGVYRYFSYGGKL